MEIKFKAVKKVIISPRRFFKVWRPRAEIYERKFMMNFAKEISEMVNDGDEKESKFHKHKSFPPQSIAFY